MQTIKGKLHRSLHLAVLSHDQLSILLLYSPSTPRSRARANLPCLPGFPQWSPRAGLGLEESSSNFARKNPPPHLLQILQGRGGTCKGAGQRARGGRKEGRPLDGTLNTLLDRARVPPIA
eukprot:6166298-Pyramimonas_sp.AAC.1